MVSIDTSWVEDDSAALVPLAGWPEAPKAARAAPPAKRLWTRMRDWRARRATLRLLSSLDSRTLKDLGISPPEIDSVVQSDSDDRRRAYDRDWWRKGVEVRNLQPV